MIDSQLARLILSDDIPPQLDESGDQEEKKEDSFRKESDRYVTGYTSTAKAELEAEIEQSEEQDREQRRQNEQNKPFAGNIRQIRAAYMHRQEHSA